MCLTFLGAGFGGTCPFAAEDPVCMRTGRGGGLTGAGLAGTTLELCTWVVAGGDGFVMGPRCRWG